MPDGRRACVLIVAAAAVLAACSGGERGASDPEPLPTGPPTTPLEEACDAVARAAIAGRTEPPPSGSGLGEVAQREALREIHDCRAVALDEAAQCRLAAPRFEANCRARWRFFHDARRPAPRWPIVMADALAVECGPNMPAAFCEALDAAVRAQDPSRCPGEPAEARELCEGIASSDPGRCTDTDCRELAGRLRMLRQGGGLERVAREGTPRDRVTAAAALEGLGACEAWVPSFRRVCAR